MTAPETYPNPDLVVKRDNKTVLNLPETRRQNFRDLHRIQRYSFSFRSDHVLALSRDIDPAIGQREDVRRLTESREFCALVVLKGQRLLHESYARDFSANDLHTTMSVTKLTCNLIIGQLVANGKIDLRATVKNYLPEIGTGYANATIQQVLHMDVENSYSESYDDPFSTVFENEAALGWRLPRDGQPEQDAKSFLCSVTKLGDSLRNTSKLALYKTANCDILGWIAERVSGRPLRDWVLDLVEATGIEAIWNMQTDRSGFPLLGSGASLTARDLARFGQLFCRYGEGVKGRKTGDRAFIEATRKHPGKQVKPHLPGVFYSNQTITNGEWLGHGGYGGQFLMANPETGVSVTLYSVLETRDATNPQYQADFIRTLEAISRSV